MKKLWKKFHDLYSQCYLEMIQPASGLEAWNSCYSTLLEIIDRGRESDASFAPELYCLDDDTDYAHDVESWLDDYLDELDMAAQYEELEAVCRRVAAMFTWKEADPSELYFRISSALSAQGKTQEALSFCEDWYKKDSDNAVAATAFMPGLM